MTLVAITGASGRLGRAIVAAAVADPAIGPGGVVSWTRSDFDLDQPAEVAGLVGASRVGVVIHAAAWTDVDGCARDPALAMRRNGDATAALAEACRAAGTDLLIVSTNEVFDGQRTDGHGYRPTDPVAPINAYGASKLAGEDGARAAFGAAGSSGPRLSIVRTAWLFGPPATDFPAKILAAAGRARGADEPLRLVVDEIGSPTYAPDLAAALVRFVVARVPGGTFHAVNAGMASRSAWAREVLRIAGTSICTVDVTADSWERPSRAPRWAVLESSPELGPLRAWQDALAVHIAGTARARAGAA